ncbi:trehalose-phosphatase [Sphingomonas sp. ID0503]|uniref:trehalose-phosphatase n=1 Tax=Sphingomonas sp. ID0503 TaxID=3399691 RepID=UPI003AFB1A36
MQDLPPPPDDLLNGASLFLDFDGTLVDLAPRPEDVRVDDALRLLVARLGRAMEGRLAIVSGRAIEAIDRHLGPEGISVSGSHGLELRGADGRLTVPERPAALAALTERARAFGAANPGVVIEEKPFGLGFHYRLVPEAEAASHALAEAMAAEAGLHLQPGKMMIELRVAGGDKGTALATMMKGAGMAGTRPVFIGDDLTDEPAFVQAEAMGGAGILVGPARATGARYRLDDVAATLGWLDAFARAAA